MPCDEVVDWLSTAYRSGMTDDLLGDIFNDVHHQGDTSEAMYAAAPHLVDLAGKCSGSVSVHTIANAGSIYASSGSRNAVPCPDDLKEDFDAAREVGRQLTLTLLSRDHEFDDFKYLLAALAGFSGHGRFGRIIEGFDLFENQFHHAMVDEPLEDEY